MNQFLSIQIGDLIGFSHRGDWTTGEVVEIAHSTRSMTQQTMRSSARRSPSELTQARP